MARVFISFLGIGGQNGYNPISYSFRGKALSSTRFVQRALMDEGAYGPSYFDRLLILVTQKSREKNWQALRAELIEAGVQETRIRDTEISEDLSNEAAHWEWFEQVLEFLKPEDELVLDLTHGFRIVPIVLSAAIGYLQASKNVRLEAVLYGADQSGGQIVDVKGFYRVNAWADAVSRLVEKADADKLAALAETDEGKNFPNLKDPELIKALRDLSGILTNIEVHHVAERARNAVTLVKDRMQKARGAERQMLTLVADKFATLVSDVPPDGKYSQPYLEVQVKVAQMLLEHGLNMQAYTVMRELVGSIGMLGLIGTKYHTSANSADGRKMRGRFAETFISMLNYDEDKWKFKSDEQKRDADTLKPWYSDLQTRNLLQVLREASRGMMKTRNGFDHAWTAVVAPENHEKFREDGERELRKLETVVKALALLPSTGTNTPA